MDDPIIIVDKSVIFHGGLVPRRFSGVSPVWMVGRLRNKREEVDRVPVNLGFSYVLRGHGACWVEGVQYPVQAPALVNFWPGEHVRFGPVGSWDETFILYRPECLEFFHQRGLIDASRRVIACVDAAGFLECHRQFLECLEGQNTGEPADELDRRAELLLLAAMRPVPVGQAADPLAAGVARVRRRIDEELSGRLNIDELARSEGMSVSTFRRHWGRYVNVSPLTYVTHRRIQRACQLLTDTGLSVSQIGQAVGYEDSHYFSRVFSREIGEPPSSFRARYEA